MSPAMMAMDVVLTRIAFPPVDDADLRPLRVKGQ
jgi:hypothetical protein